MTDIKSDKEDIQEIKQRSSLNEEKTELNEDIIEKLIMLDFGDRNEVVSAINNVEKKDKNDINRIMEYMLEKSQKDIVSSISNSVKHL